MAEPLTTGPAPSATGFRVEFHDSVPSTNSLAMAAARAGDAGRLWILAHEQTAGRGRRGRAWASSRGNLFASVLLIDPQPKARIAELPLVAAVALAEAVERAAGAHGLVGLKWPNDLLVEGAKLSGILLEAETLADGRLAVVCGFGVNCVSHPEPDGYKATDLAALGYRIGAGLLFDRLAATFGAWLDTWSADNGFDVVRRAWMGRALRLGETITVRTGTESAADLTGRFCEIDGRGQLVLQLDDGTIRTISAGDVFFGRLT
ncbi:biotin--[acetyl-CoA-carboxylase] ligase [Polymorphum gilvum]|uniref:biotin--[biotin carboxyl-carrier protein] ligase n=1 Tax=Polymorphum gilvum (strain LMG 25793 / CGMCC 1.9160 / SL003B-26A1) TaxID=991905 RepID=F2IY05_POLGS|nr:biotin--[acetyl-CoA-carboxylase] ligase [Polymorphum gilvum]ADZ70508.1 Biotin-(Acetyl-CoA-carboxylase) ligase [Polymorphum gilvum SL003B-26A1]